MADLYERNGVLLLDDNGTSLRGCCCKNPPEVSLNYSYYLATPPGDNLHGLSGTHYIQASTDASHFISNSSNAWSGSSATWQYCTSSNRVYFASGSDCYGCPNGAAQIALELNCPVSISLALLESRTFQESWSSDLIAQLYVYSIGANTRLDIAGQTISTTGTHIIKTWSGSEKKTNTNTIDNRNNPWTLTVYSI